MNSHSRRWMRQGRPAGKAAGAARHGWQTRQNRPPRRGGAIKGSGEHPPLSTDPGALPPDKDKDKETPRERPARLEALPPDVIEILVDPEIATSSPLRPAAE